MTAIHIGFPRPKGSGHFLIGSRASARTRTLVHGSWRSSARSGAEDRRRSEEGPDGWRGVQAREQVIKRALFDTLMDESEVERIFLIIKAQGEY